MKRSKKKPLKKTFKEAVVATPDVKNAYSVGLTGLGSHSSKVDLADTRKCGGSLDIDTTVTAKYPNANRWDYAFAYDGEVFFVEVHTAGTGQVDKVIRKLEWLKSWLHEQAPEINRLKAVGKPAFYWVQSNGNHIEKNSRQSKRVAQAGINLKPISKVILK